MKGKLQISRFRYAACLPARQAALALILLLAVVGVFAAPPQVAQASIFTDYGEWLKASLEGVGKDLSSGLKFVFGERSPPASSLTIPKIAQSPPPPPDPLPTLQPSSQPAPQPSSFPQVLSQAIFDQLARIESALTDVSRIRVIEGPQGPAGPPGPPGPQGPSGVASLGASFSNLSTNKVSVSGNYDALDIGRGNFTVDEAGNITSVSGFSGQGISGTSLTITGQTTLNGVAYTWPSADGSTNQVLATDGSGALSWTTTSGTLSGSGNVNQLAFWTATSTLSGSSTFVWDNTLGRLGIGDSTPDHTLDVAGNIGLSASGFINFGDTTGSSGYGFRDNSGSIEFKDSGGAWSAFDSLGTVGGTGSAGQVSFWTATSTLSATSVFVWDNTLGRLGIGTSSPSDLLHVSGGSTRIRGANSVLLSASTEGFGGALSGIAIYGQSSNCANPTTDASTRIGILGSTGCPGSFAGVTAGIYAETGGFGPSAAFIANSNTTISSSDIARFQRQGTTKVLITNSGNLGVGTESPAARLTVHETADAASNLVAILRGNDRSTPADNDEAYVSFTLEDDSNAQAEFARLTWSATDVTSGTRDGLFKFSTMENDSLTDVMTITASSVGIGTTSPTSIFHVNRLTNSGEVAARIDYGFGTGLLIDAGGSDSTGIRAEGDVGVYGYGCCTGSSFIGVVGEGHKIGVRAITRSTSSGIGLEVDTQSNTDTAIAVFEHKNSEKMRIDISGDVGIGTTSPASRLHLLVDDANTASTVDLLTLDHTVTATSSAGIGAGILFRAENDGGATVNAGQVAGSLTDVTSGSEDGILTFSTIGPDNTTLSERLTITATGVGIGTTDPADKLEVSNGSLRVRGTNNFLFSASTRGFGGALSGVAIYGQSSNCNLPTTDANTRIGVYGDRGCGPDIQGVEAGVYATAGGGSTANALIANLNGIGNSIVDFQDSGTSVFTIKDGGNVGIATSTPSGILHVTTASSMNALVVDSPSGNVGIGTASPAEKLHIIENDPDEGFLVESTVVNSRPRITIKNDAKSWVLKTDGSVSDAFIIREGGTADRFVMLPTSGSVGIGDTGPDALLEVSASGGATDLFMLSSDDENDGDRFIVKNSGLVGVATSTPAWKLHVWDGGICVDAIGGGDCPAEVAGAVAVDTGPGASTATSVISFDIAERYPSTEVLQAGDLVTGDPDNPGHVKKSSEPYQSNILGIVSPKPAISMEGSTLFLAPTFQATSTNPNVALAGRVHVKVSLENGPIKQGDLLTSSSEPGKAMKATEPGRVIGMALEPFDSAQGENQTVLVFINPHWSMGSLDESGLLSGDQEEETEEGFIARVKRAIESLTGTIKTAGEWVFDRVKAQAVDVAGKITARTAKVEQLEIIDRKTGDIYCTWIENGEWVKLQAECDKVQYLNGQPIVVDRAPRHDGGQAVHEDPPSDETVEEQSQTEAPIHLDLVETTSEPVEGIEDTPLTETSSPSTDGVKQ